MFAMSFNWKAFSVNIQAVETWVRANTTNTFAGSSADTSLTLWFNSEISDNQKQAITSYWAGITDQSAEATSYVSSDDIAEAIAALRSGMINKSWDQLTFPERKILLGQTPTNEELGF